MVFGLFSSPNPPPPSEPRQLRQARKAYDAAVLSQSLQNYRQAELEYKYAYNLFEYDELDHTPHVWRLSRAEALIGLADCLLLQPLRRADAEKLYASLLKCIKAENSRTSTWRAQCYYGLAVCYHERFELDKANALYRSALEWLPKARFEQAGTTNKILGVILARQKEVDVHILRRLLFNTLRSTVSAVATHAAVNRFGALAVWSASCVCGVVLARTAS